MSTPTDWILALSSTAAAVGTVSTLAYSVRTSRRQVDNERRQQASRIIVTSDVPHSYVAIHNGSEHAIYSVMTWAHGNDGTDQVSPDQHPIVTPDQQVIADVATLTQYATPWFGSVEVLFTDDGGRRWSREVNGQLREVTWQVAGVGGPSWFRPLPRRLRKLLVWTGNVDFTSRH